MKLFNKRGQDLPLGAIILIVLGVVVLVLVILGFSIGWDNLWAKINIFGGRGSTIGDVVTRCNLAITSNSVYDYCNFYEVKEGGQLEYLNCQDSRVEGQLDKKLDCNGRDYLESARLYCNRIGNSLGERIVKVNGLSCLSSSVAKCEEIVGEGADGEELRGEIMGDSKGQSGEQLSNLIKNCREKAEGGVKWRELLSGFQEAKNAERGKSVVCCVPENYGPGVIRTQN